MLAVEFDNDVNPVTQDYLTDEIDRANKDGYDAVVIVLDTPGGLSESMRKIVKKELASKIPVIVYVVARRRARRLGRRLDRPGGRHPRDGAADEHRLVDADQRRRREHPERPAPQGRQRRGRVADGARRRRTAATSVWADAAVREASNLPARAGAPAERDRRRSRRRCPRCSNKIDGRKTIPKGFVLHTAGAEVTTVKMSFWKRILDTLIDPNLIALMLSLGVLGIVVELWHPGLIFPATFGDPLPRDRASTGSTCCRSAGPGCS